MAPPVPPVWRRPSFRVDKLEYAGSGVTPLRRWQLLSDEHILMVGSRDDVERGVRNNRLPTWRQLICGVQAWEGMLTRRPGEGVAILAGDLHGHDDGKHWLLDNGAHEHAGYSFTNLNRRFATPSLEMPARSSHSV
jgi:hypothetical protein